jgi:hypothetical protein
MSSTAIFVHEHTVPAGATVLRPRICQNCGRSAFIHLGAKHACCCRCLIIVTTAGNQLWECLRCGTLRAWGLGQPHETAAKFLRCEICASVKRHAFKKVVA